MERILTNIEPKAIFSYFEDLTAIPHGSGNENGVADYVENFAKSHRLEYYRDALNNILIKKTATPGKENSPVVMLQGHLDMVCEKNSNVEHDFLSDPLKVNTDGEWVYAEGTSLGGDDGIAVASMLAILDGDNLKNHPALECLFTVDEEVGMKGALGFDYSKCDSTMLINLDSEDEGTAIIGCAYSSDSIVTHICETVPLYGKCVEISLLGLAGGHSGGDIHRERANAIVKLGRVLSVLYDETPFNLVYIGGGDKVNAIPREIKAIIAVTDFEGTKDRLQTIFAKVKKEFGKEDRKCRFFTDKAKTASLSYGKMLTYKETSRILSFITVAPCGVITNDLDGGIVEASTNLASVYTNGGELTIKFMSRSSRDSILHEIERRIAVCARLCDYDVRIEGSHPGWTPIYGTALQEVYKKTFDTLFPDLAPSNVMPIHAGLECGVISEGMKKVKGEDFELDAISIGPQMHDIHSPNERLSIPSTGRFWKTVCTILENL